MDVAPDWLARFAAQLTDSSALAGLTAAGLTQQPLALYKSCRTAWPEVDFPLQDFAAHIGSHCPQGGDIASGLLAMRARRSKAERILAYENALPIEALPSGANPEIDYLKERYTNEFRIARDGSQTLVNRSWAM